MTSEDGAPISDSLEPLVSQFATELNETNPKAQDQIRGLLKEMGVDFVQTLVKETLEVEQNGGMLLPDGSRRRTTGGVFFFLVRQQLNPEQLNVIFPRQNGKAKKDAPASDEVAPGSAPAPFIAEPAAPPPPPIDVTPAARLFAGTIAKQLKEVSPEIHETFARLVQAAGMRQAQIALEDTLSMENQGGLKRPDRTRRTPGEAFMFIISRRLNDIQRRQVWPQGIPADLGASAPVRQISEAPRLRPQSAGAPPVVPARPKPVAPAGTATTAKITLVGRPIQIEMRPGYVAFRLTSGRTPNLPKGLPIPDTATNYTIYVAERQWKKVAAAAEDADDSIIVEGYPSIDLKLPGIAVYATNVLSKLAQSQKSG